MEKKLCEENFEDLGMVEGERISQQDNNSKHTSKKSSKTRESHFLSNLLNPIT